MRGGQEGGAVREAARGEGGRARADLAASRDSGVPVIVGAMHVYDPAIVGVAGVGRARRRPLVRSLIVLPPNDRFVDSRPRSCTGRARRPPAGAGVGGGARGGAADGDPRARHAQPADHPALRARGRRAEVARMLRPWGYELAFRGGGLHGAAAATSPAGGGRTGRSRCGGTGSSCTSRSRRPTCSPARPPSRCATAAGERRWREPRTATRPSGGTWPTSAAGPRSRRSGRGGRRGPALRARDQRGGPAAPGGRMTPLTVALDISQRHRDRARASPERRPGSSGRHRARSSRARDGTRRAAPSRPARGSRSPRC